MFSNYLLTSKSARPSPIVIVVLRDLPQTHAPQRAHFHVARQERVDEPRRLLREILVRHVPHLSHAVEARPHVLRPLKHRRVVQVLIPHAPHDPDLRRPGLHVRGSDVLHELLKVHRGRGRLERVPRRILLRPGDGELVLLHRVRADRELVPKVRELVDIRGRAFAHPERPRVHRERVRELVPVPERRVEDDDASKELRRFRREKQRVLRRVKAGHDEVARAVDHDVRLRDERLERVRVRLRVVLERARGGFRRAAVPREVGRDALVPDLLELAHELLVGVRAHPRAVDEEDFVRLDLHAVLRDADAVAPLQTGRGDRLHSLRQRLDHLSAVRVEDFRVRRRADDGDARGVRGARGRARARAEEASRARVRARD